MINQPYQPTQVMGQQANSQVQGTSYKIGNGMPMMSPTPGLVSPSSTGGVPPLVSSGAPMTPTGGVVTTTAPQFEQSYIENILRLNLGKCGTFYMTYEGNKEWNARIFQGILEAAGRDHIIISDPNSGKRIMLLMVNFDYATFDEPLLYQYPGVIGNYPQQPSRR
ncbi:spore coat protein GerQ [Paenibacillus xylanivorans]|uniref:Spore gernimation protein GerQ n=1 Tax=Paenibacillus xylanivorans TaxID=1705561 RepID=A0A0N0C478_9BACL|nr:spore gernimation protein GerQ [Paenibacillus xylanivorans]